MNIKFLVLPCLLALAACTTQTFKKPPYNDPADDATIKLAEAADSVSNSMLDMAQTEKVLFPAFRSNESYIPNTAALQKRASVDWAGPIEELTKKVADAAHYKFRVLGKAPAIPIVMSLTKKDESLADLLRDMDYQAASKAFIRVDVQRQVIELRYANYV